jgi:hypothetical protein
MQKVFPYNFCRIICTVKRVVNRSIPESSGFPLNFRHTRRSNAPRNAEAKKQQVSCWYLITTRVSKCGGSPVERLQLSQARKLLHPSFWKVGTSAKIQRFQSGKLPRGRKIHGYTYFGNCWKVNISHRDTLCEAQVLQLRQLLQKDNILCFSKSQCRILQLLLQWIVHPLKSKSRRLTIFWRKRRPFHELWHLRIHHWPTFSITGQRPILRCWSLENWAKNRIPESAIVESEISKLWICPACASPRNKTFGRSHEGAFRFFKCLNLLLKC